MRPGLLAGVDEVGRGPLAGPVVAAAVMLLPDASLDDLDRSGPVRSRADRAGASWLDLVDDSKLVPPARREHLYGCITGTAIAWAVAVVAPAEIDRLGIARASALAMAEAVRQLVVRPDFVLTDAFPIPGLVIPQQAIVHGDRLSRSIAAASIVAKVTRDRLMADLDDDFPGYGFARHKGYPTPEHLAALARLGPSPIHRRSFGPVRDWPHPRPSATPSPRCGEGDGG